MTCRSLPKSSLEGNYVFPLFDHNTSPSKSNPPVAVSAGVGPLEDRTCLMYHDNDATVNRPKLGL